VNATEDLLRGLAANDERSARSVLSGERTHAHALDRLTRALVQLAALLAVDAPTVTLRWAVDIASAAGADDDALVRVLVAAASATGTAQTVTSAPRLALALGVDLELEGWDGT
jgi:4-carboxymuconolactone decarboxylase